MCVLSVAIDQKNNSVVNKKKKEIEKQGKKQSQQAKVIT